MNAQSTSIDVERLFSKLKKNVGEGQELQGRKYRQLYYLLWQFRNISN